MPMSRLCGGIRMISCPATWMLPASGRVNPARIISSVVLPEPEGPSSVMNSPAAMSMSMPSSATKSP